MALLSGWFRRYEVTAADGGSWAKIAQACGCTREQLWQHNTPDGKYRPLTQGERLLVPFRRGT